MSPLWSPQGHMKHLGTPEALGTPEGHGATRGTGDTKGTWGHQRHWGHQRYLGTPGAPGDTRGTWGHQGHLGTPEGPGDPEAPRDTSLITRSHRRKEIIWQAILKSVLFGEKFFASCITQDMNTRNQACISLPSVHSISPPCIPVHDPRSCQILPFLPGLSAVHIWRVCMCVCMCRHVCVYVCMCECVHV